MFDDIAAYYEENVVSAFVEYRAKSREGIAGRSRDIRMALQAAGALFHFREHLTGPHTLSRAETERRCPDYGLLGDVVNAAKHRTVANLTPHGPPLISQASDIYEVIELIEYRDELGPYRFVQKSVVVRLNDATERKLISVLESVLDFWESHLVATGLLASARTFTRDSRPRHRRRDEVEDGRLDFEVVRGQRFAQKFRLLRFVEATFTVEPIDLTGLAAEAVVYKPQIVDLTLTHGSGVQSNAAVTLTLAESNLLAQLTSDLERQAFVQSLPSAQRAFAKLVEDYENAAMQTQPVNDADA